MQVKDYTGFECMVNIHLEERNQAEASSEEEVRIVQKWYELNAIKRGAHMHAVSEIMETRSRSHKVPINFFKRFSLRPVATLKTLPY